MRDEDGEMWREMRREHWRTGILIRESHHVLAAWPQAEPPAFVEVAEDAVQVGG
jgi:hypothetical protein